MRTPHEDLMLDYRRHLLAAGKGIGTVKQRLAHMERLSGHFRGRDLLEARTEDLEHFLSLRRRTLAPETRRSIRNSFQSFYGWAKRAGRIDENPAEMLEPIYIPRAAGRRAPDEAVVQALRAAPIHEQAMILLGRLACLRLNEITTLHSDQREGDVLRIFGKGERVRLVPIHPDLLEILERIEIIQGRGYYFPGRYGAHMHPQSVNKIITRRLGHNPHSLRHAGATAAFRGTGDLRAVQEMLGHASVATTQLYIHVGIDEVRAAAMATTLHWQESGRE